MRFDIVCCALFAYYIKFCRASSSCSTKFMCLRVYMYLFKSVAFFGMNDKTHAMFEKVKRHIITHVIQIVAIVALHAIFLWPVARAQLS